MNAREHRAAYDVAEVRALWESLDEPDPGKKKSRRQEAVALLAITLMRDAASSGRPLSRAQARRLAADALAERSADYNRRLQKWIGRLQRTSLTARRNALCPEVEMHAVLQLPEMRWLWGWMTRAGRGRSARRDRLLCVLFQMAWSAHRPCVEHALSALEGSAKLGWAFDYRTEGPKKQTIYKTLRGMCVRKDCTVALHINLDLIRRLAALTGPDGQLLHPDLGRYLGADGKFVQAHIRQEPPRDREHEDLMRRFRSMAEFRVHRRDGQVILRVFGYKIVVISCLTTGLPLIWGIYGAKAHEPDRVLELLGELRRLWPELPAEYLVADALYDTEPFQRRLWAEHSIHPVAREDRGTKYRDDMPYWDKSPVAPGDLGVPSCAHGAMARKPGGFHGHAKRRELDVPYGEPMPGLGGAVIRWLCPEQECNEIRTHFWKYPRLYSYLPRSGDSDPALLRQALYVRRNDVESLFALVHYFGVDGSSPVRAQWADDDGMCWLISLMLLYLTARRVVHETGLYAESHVEAQSLDVRKVADADDPSPGPDREQAAAARERRRRNQPAMRPPATWPQEDETGYCTSSAADADRGM